MDDENKLVPVEQHTIEFHGDELQAVRMANGEIYVAVRPMCEYIGVDWSSQRKRLIDDPILSNHLNSVVFNTTEIDPSSNKPRSMEMIGLRLEFVNGWLFKIDSRRVKEDAREQLLHYQERCYMVLAEAFNNTKTGRLMDLYRKQGRDPEWIQRRLLGIDVRNDLETEWKARGIKSGQEYGALTNEIYDGAFGLTHAEYMELKELESDHNLRDHMSTGELLVTAVGEYTTTEVARRDDAQGFEQNMEAAREGGEAAKETRELIERRTGKDVVTGNNFLPDTHQPTLLGDEPADE